MQSRFTLRQFRYFLAVAETGSTAAAARMVNIAQSAITKSISEIEESLSLQLFERSAKGMQLTQQGQRFQVSARKVLAAVEEAAMIDRDMPTALTGDLTLGVTPLVSGYYLAELFARYQRSHPGARLTVVEDSPKFLEHLLINGEIDLAIMVTNGLNDPQALVVDVLTRSSNHVWLSSNHPLVNQSELTLAECANYPTILLEADRIDAVVKDAWHAAGLRPDVMLRTSSLEAVRSLVGVSAGVAILPDFLYRPWTLDAHHIEVRRLREPLPSIDVGLVWRRANHARPEVSEFITIAREQSKLAKRKVLA